MSRQVYIANLTSSGINFATDALKSGDTPERICAEQSNYALFHDIIADAHINKMSNSRIIDPDCCFIIMSKDDMLRYLDKDKYRQRPECFPYLEKELYEKISSEQIDYLLSVANGLSNDEEYLLVACVMASLEEFIAEGCGENCKPAPSIRR